MDLRQGIMATAQSLGINPIDLATAISYETGGTFNPTQPGPHTQWGQHRGLIQFGEPQAKKYGVDWNDPVGSQLGPNGAVANYLRDTGVRPGMGMMDIYSAINAGAVGKYGASDANNGGAPGTVADKVNNQMSGHRAKAEQLFAGPDGPKGQESYPAPTPFGSMSPRPSGMSIDPIAASLYPEGEKKGKGLGSRLQAFGKAIDTEVPAPVSISGGGGDARATGDALLKAMQNPSMYAQMFLKKRMI